MENISNKHVPIAFGEVLRKDTGARTGIKQPIHKMRYRNDVETQLRTYGNNRELSEILLLA